MKLHGKVMDSVTKNALPFTNVALKNTSIGTVTNELGQFELHISGAQLSDSIKFSFIGYKTQTHSLEHLEKEGHTILLEAHPSQLNEVVVTSFNPLELIEKAVRRIPDNYGKAHTITSFYRMATQNEQHFMHLSEVVMEQYHPGYQAGQDKRQIKLIKMRALMDEKSSHGVELGMKPKGVLFFDVVSTLDKLNLLNKKGLKKHRFELEGEIIYEAQRAFVITFDQKNGLKESLYSGKIYLEKENLAILYLEYGLSSKGLAYAKYGDGPTRTLLKLFGMNIQMQKENYKIHYKKYGDRWYLSKVANDTWLNISSDREYYNFPTFARVEYVVTEIDTTKSQPFSNKEVTGNGKIFEEQFSEYDANFWNNYNIILPDFDFQKIADGIEQRNKKFDYKKQIADQIHKFPKNPAVRIDSILNFYHQANLFHGSVVIKKGAELIYQKGFGLANETLGIPNTTETKFRIGSIAKTFTSMLIMQLVEAEKLQLNDTIGQYLPNYPNGQVTIAQLLTHQSGIPSYTKNTQYLAKIMEQSYSLDSLIIKFASDSLEFLPGTAFEYSNSGYLLLARIIEQVTSKSFAQVAKDYIIDPLKLDDTYVGQVTQKKDKQQAIGYFYGKPEPEYPIGNTIGAGGITTNAKDLLKWSEALDGTSLLNEKVKQTLFHPHAAYKEWDSFYGYGWLIDGYQFKASKKHKIIYHPGTDMGFYSMLVKQQDDLITIILLSNHGDFPRFDITDLILSVLN